MCLHGALTNAQSRLPTACCNIRCPVDAVDLQIRTVIGPKVIDYTKGVAYLDPRTPANIYHKDPSIEQFSAIHAPSSPPAPAPVAAATAGGPPAGLQQISCEQYLLQTYGPLQHLELPCVAVKLSATACQDAELREQFIHYPLELCRFVLCNVTSSCSNRAG